MIQAIRERPSGFYRKAALAAFHSVPSIGVHIVHADRFAEWRPYTSPDTGRAGWISSAGQVRYEDPRGKEQTKTTDTSGAVIQEELKRNPKLLPRISAAAGRAREAVYGMMVRATPAMLSLMPDVLDTPQDFAKIGFNPGMAGVGPRVHDPVSSATGISSHVAAAIASRVIAKAITWARGRNRQLMAEDSIENAADFLTELYRRVGYALGVDFGISRETVLAALSSQKQFADNTVPKSDVALAGSDGQALVKLMGKSKQLAIDTFNGTMREAVKRYDGSGKLFNKDEEKTIANALAAIRGSAELLGRSRVRERVERMGMEKFSDIPLSTFAAGDPSVLTTPGRALAYFRSLIPTLGVDPQRWPGEQLRRAFTLAASTNRTLTTRIQELIGEGLAKNLATADITSHIVTTLDSAGVTPRNPQYAEMVVRTNCNDSFQSGMWHEAQSEDIKHVFPVWEYLGINDHRAGADHRPRFGKYYPRDATFADVRGNRPFNCRCSLRWIDVYEWEDLQRNGVKVETSWEPIP